MFNLFNAYSLSTNVFVLMNRTIDSSPYVMTNDSSAMSAWSALIRWSMISLLLIAFGLRIYRLDHQSLWYDEGVTVTIAQRPLAKLTAWTARDIQPPLYYYFVAFWGRIAGWSEWSLRFPSLFWGVLTLPLLGALTRFLARNQWVTLFALLLATPHPLLLYYSQEARMYAMLTALGILCGYCLLRSTEYRSGNENIIVNNFNYSQRLTFQWSITYILVATAAVYTHYFAYFLLLALNLAILLIQLPTGRATQLDNSSTQPQWGQLLGHLVLINGTILVLYVPWIVVMLTQLTSDTSYWEGVLKVDEAVRRVVVSFVHGETGLESEIRFTLIPILLITFLLFLIQLLNGIRQLKFRQRSLRTTLIGLLWFVVPVMLTLLLAVFIPKFNARYVMIALPGLLLLWSAGLVSLMAFDFSHTSLTNISWIWLRRSFGAICLLFILGVFLQADYNLFIEPSFVKSQWREAVHHIRKRLREKETVILVSGHAWPVWDYYAPDIPAARLPDLEIIDVNAVLDYETSARLITQALTQDADNIKDRTWLISWQDEVVDPMGVVGLHLEQASFEKIVEKEFWHLNVRRFRDIDLDVVRSAFEQNRLTATALSSSSTQSSSIGSDTENVENSLLNPGFVDVDVNFGRQVLLDQYTVDPKGDLLLFWRTATNDQHRISDLRLTLETLTTDGVRYAKAPDQRPSNYRYPAFRWQPNQTIVGRITVADWAGPGAIPGQYQVRLGMYDIEDNGTQLDIVGPDGALQGKATTLAVTLPVTTTGVWNTSIPATSLLPELEVQISLATSTAALGQPLHLQLIWHTKNVVDGDFDLELSWRKRGDDRIVHREVLALGPDFPTNQWSTNSVLRTVYKVRVPTMNTYSSCEEKTTTPATLPNQSEPCSHTGIPLAAGDYWLDIGLVSEPATTDERTTARLELALVENDILYTAPPLATPLNILLGDQISLLGLVNALPSLVSSGSEYPIRLFWSAEWISSADYSVTVQWLNHEGVPASQVDSRLPDGTSNWLEQQVVGQTLTVPTPDQIGQYLLIVALYDDKQPGFPRLLTEQGRDFVEIGRIVVE